MLDRVADATRSRLIAVLDRTGPPHLAGRPRDFETPLVDLGLTSFDIVNVMLAVEAEFDIVIPQADISPQNFRSLASIEVLLIRLGVGA
jgi:hypothetical protein